MDKVDIVTLKTFADMSCTLAKARQARALIDASGCDVRLQIDGGVSRVNIRAYAEAGVDVFVAGSAIFREPRTLAAYAATIGAMRAELAAAAVPPKPGLCTHL
jgi:ribulose-phosphate 3-epimerase